MQKNALGPSLPENWYLLGASADFPSGKIVPRHLANQAFVVFRGLKTGQLFCFAAACAHMGCSLTHATVKNDSLVCGLHHRVIGPTGTFGNTELRQPSYQIAEAMGGVFIFCGPGQAPALPTPHEEAPGILIQRYAGEYRFPLSWQVLVANGFDVEHLSAVHERKLQADPTLEIRDRQIVLHYHTQPTGSGLSDRLTRWMSPQGILGTIRALGGSMMLVESVVGKRRAFILLSFVPEDGKGTVIRGIVGARVARQSILNAVSLWATQKLFLAFLRKDLGVLHDLQWHEPKVMVTLGDKFTTTLCDYFRKLPDAA